MNQEYNWLACWAARNLTPAQIASLIQYGKREGAFDARAFSQLLLRTQVIVSGLEAIDLGRSADLGRGGQVEGQTPC